jgi:hypothetical protein
MGNVTAASCVATVDEDQHWKLGTEWHREACPLVAEMDDPFDEFDDDDFDDDFDDVELPF